MFQESPKQTAQESFPKIYPIQKKLQKLVRTDLLHLIKGLETSGVMPELYPSNFSRVLESMFAKRRHSEPKDIVS